VSQGSSGKARRLSSHSVMHGQGRSLDVGARDGATVISEDAEEYRFGFERGYTDGLRQARAELEAAAEQARAEWERKAQDLLDDAQASLQRSRESLSGVAEALTEALHEDRRWAESMAVEMAYAALLHVLGGKAADHALVAELCAQARREIGSELVSVRVAPADVEQVQSLLGAIQVIADDTLEVGSCVLDSRRGRFDAGLETRLEQLRSTMLAALYAGDHRA